MKLVIQKNEWHGKVHTDDTSHTYFSYARTTIDFKARGLDGAGRDADEYKRASAKTFHHILMNCTLLLTLTGL